MCEEQPENLPLSVAKLFGGYIWNVKGELSEGDIRYFISFYQFLAVSPIDEQRIMCAYNFPVSGVIFGCV